MVEIVWLATTVVGKFLIPLFTKGKDKLTEDLAESGGKAVADGLVGTAGALWKRIKSRFDQTHEKNAVSLFEENPEAMEKMLIELLRKRLEGDAGFCREIQKLVDAPVAGTGETSWQLMGTYVGAVDARNSHISGGTVAGVVLGTPSTDDPKRTRDSSDS